MTLALCAPPENGRMSLRANRRKAKNEEKKGTKPRLARYALLLRDAFSPRAKVETARRVCGRARIVKLERLNS